MLFVITNHPESISNTFKLRVECIECDVDMTNSFLERRVEPGFEYTRHRCISCGISKLIPKRATILNMWSEPIRDLHGVIVSLDWDRHKHSHKHELAMARVSGTVNTGLNFTMHVSEQIMANHIHWANDTITLW